MRPKKLKTRPAWKTPLIVLGISFTLLGNSRCAHTGPQDPVPSPPGLNIRLWAGDSAAAGIRRAQENQFLACSDGRFDEFVAMTYADAQFIYDLIVYYQTYCSCGGSAGEY
jgi:hypothetical protein